jgi:hypothetical protein
VHPLGELSVAGLPLIPAHDGCRPAVGPLGPRRMRTVEHRIGGWQQVLMKALAERDAVGKRSVAEDHLDDTPPGVRAAHLAVPTALDPIRCHAFDC